MQRASAALLSAALLHGCAGHPTYEQGLRVRWADDVGSVTISRSGDPIPWDEVASELQPSFKMDSAAALAAAIPMSQSLDERLADVLTANLQAGLPSSGFSHATKSVTDPETGEVVTTVDNSRERKSGTAPAPATLSPAGAAALSALSGGTLEYDPMLRYLAATALQQEVALLNRYIRNAVRWPGAQAFVTRFQLNVMPHARTMPYDVEADITVHAEDEQSRAELSPPLETPEEFAAGGMARVASAAEQIKRRQDRCAPGSYDTVQVLPMIVTDNIEGLRAARTTDNVRQLALALTATSGGVGAGAQFGRTIEALRRTEGRDTNSLLTVAKLSDDTVRVRLGAAQSPRFGYVMTHRNHYISLVVLFRPCLAKDKSGYADEGNRVLTAVTRTTFRDGETGRALEYEDGTKRLYRQIEHIQSRFVGQFNYLELARLYQWASRQEREKFFNYVIAQHPQASMCRSTLVRLFGSSAFKMRPNDRKLLSEPNDYTPGSDGSPVANDGSELPAAAAGRNADCLTLASTRYRLVAAPLWTELQSLRPTGQFAFTNVPIKLRRPKPALPPLQVALVNYSEGEGSVTLVQARDLSKETVQVTLLGAPDGPIPASETTVSADGRSVAAKFPPLGRFGVSPASAPAAKDATPRTYRLELRVSSAAPSQCAEPQAQGPLLAPAGSRSGALGLLPEEISSGDGWCTAHYPARLFNAAAPAATSPFSLAASATGIVADPRSGSGRLIVMIGRAKSAPASAATSLYLTLEGAQIKDARERGGAVLTPDAEGWKVSGPGELALDLENLVPNTLVKLTLKDGTLTAGSISRSVVASAVARQD